MIKNPPPSIANVRPPIVAVMGHIDHGKSTLLDFIRQSNVVASEAGGITQSISAYEVVREKNGQPHTITFIDTPGHAAFQTMRERGAQIADIAILVVSAEEGVKPQTLEALTAITEAGLPYIVAINKIDRPNASPERTKQSLAENNILIEEYGGTIPAAAISAKTGAGIDELLDLVLLVAEISELKTDPSAAGSGYILETNRDPRQGVTATLIIKNGTVRVGDFLIINQLVAKIKRLNNFMGQAVDSLVASAPAQVLGLPELPPVGANFATATAKSAAEALAKKPEAAAPTHPTRPLTTTDDPLKAIIPVLIKADVAGAVEAVSREVKNQATPNVAIAVIGSGVGQITENDIKLASGSNRSLVLGFNVSIQPSALELAEINGITVKTFDIIYKLSEWLALEVANRTPRVTAEEVTGQAKILKFFSAARTKQVIGGSVTSGTIGLGRAVKIMRRETEIGRGKIVELQQLKTAVKEVSEGNQFGAMIDAKVTIAPGDLIQVVEMVTK